MGKGKGRGKGKEPEAPAAVPAPSMEDVYFDEDDHDIDNMDFGLPPASSLGAGSGGGGMESFMGRLMGGGGMGGTDPLLQPAFPGADGSHDVVASAVPRNPGSHDIVASAVPRPPLGSGFVPHPSAAAGPPAPDFSKWHQVYPLYLDSTKSLADGRRLPAAEAIPHPNIVVLAEAARQLQYQVTLEPNKRHPRDPFAFGRLRIQLRTAPGGAKVLGKRSLVSQLAAKYKAIETAVRNTKELEPMVKGLDYATTGTVAPLPAGHHQQQAISNQVQGQDQGKGQGKAKKKGKRK